MNSYLLHDDSKQQGKCVIFLLAYSCSSSYATVSAQIGVMANLQWYQQPSYQT